MKLIQTLSCLVVIIVLQASCVSQNKGSLNKNEINLAGDWKFQTDSGDIGINAQWFTKELDGAISLPGSMTTNNLGDDIAVNTPWIGSIIDSTWFRNPAFSRYRVAGNVKVPFWLQPVKYYKGPAWYQKEITIPDSWKGQHIELEIERSHWETTVWIDNKRIGMQNSLGTAHVFDLANLPPGKHKLTIRVDNRVKDIDVGPNSHSVSDHTQSNWNGMIGSLIVRARPLVYIKDVKLYPDIKNKQVIAKINIANEGSAAGKLSLELLATGEAGEKAESLKKEVSAASGQTSIEMAYPMGNNVMLWDEFHPNLYSMNISLSGEGTGKDEKNILFGMRDFKTDGSQFTINGRRTYLRGTLECAIFPLTGYPPTDTAAWMRIFRIAKSYGLNHMRFHSWCPPDAAFEAADRSGFYLQIECSSWANWGKKPGLGDGLPIDQYIIDESERIVNAYGNHPSFCMMAYGNEPAGKNHVQWLTDFVTRWKEKDSRRLYTTGAGWPNVPVNEYQSTPDPRIQRWGEGVNSIINGKPPAADYDWTSYTSEWSMPVVSHEIGQWCVYPDFKEMKKYTGVLKPKNFEIFQESLKEHGMAHLADSFLLASGKLQSLCYKADIEAALRTPGFGGFQLLDLHDFPGQGTALVGVLSPFWEDKGYITGKEYSQFCNSTVPLALFPKFIYLNNETLSIPVHLAHFGEKELNGITPSWSISDAAGRRLFEGKLSQTNIPIGNNIRLGTIQQSLSSVANPSKLTLSINVGNHENRWEFFVYPASLPGATADVYVTQQLDEKAITALNNGGNVLLTLKKGSVRPEKGGSVAIGFSSIFWNTAWTHGQAPHTLGILCNPSHPAFNYFPTDYYSSWQWWDGMSHSNAIVLDSVGKGLQPIVRVIDDWVTNRPLGLIFECRTGKGKLLVSGIDLLDNQALRPEARQLLFSLKKYMSSGQFSPAMEVAADKIKSMLK
jgi:hypothetical protein